MKRVLLIVGLVMAFAASPAFATDIYLTVGSSGAYVLGEAITHMDLAGGGCGAECRESTIVNELIAMSLGGRTVRTAGVVPEYYRSTTSFAPLTATSETSGFVKTSFVTSGDYIKITITRPYLYLVGAYDGGNSGAQAWYIGDISAADTLWIPKAAEVIGTPYNGTSGGQDLSASTQYGLTSWSVWNPVTVPDGGATATLLGLALTAMGLVARRIK